MADEPPDHKRRLRKQERRPRPRTRRIACHPLPSTLCVLCVGADLGTSYVCELSSKAEDDANGDSAAIAQGTITQGRRGAANR